MSHTFTTGAALFFCALTSFADWTITPIVDDMTDVTAYSIMTEGNQIEIGAIRYRPQLHVRLTPVSYDSTSNKLTAKQEAFFSIETEGLRRGQSEVKIRFDKYPAEDATVTASTERRAGFFANPSGFIAKLRASTNLLVRYTTTLGHVRTATFSTAGLDDKINAVKKMVRDK